MGLFAEFYGMFYTQMYNAIDLGDLELTKAVDDTNAEEEKEMSTTLQTHPQ